MTPSRSSRLTRSEQGVADRLMRSARSVMEMRPSRCRMSRIFRSIRSSSRISLLPGLPGPGRQSKNGLERVILVLFTASPLLDYLNVRVTCLNRGILMHVIVLGSGVIGTTTAYYLARQGAQVTVLDRQPEAACETSYANAGQVSPGYSTPWAAPGIPLKALKWLFQKDAPLAIRPDGSLFQWRWMAAMLANCPADRYAVNKERMLRLAEYSRDCLRALRADTGIQYEERARGTLQLFRTQAQYEAAQRDIEVLEANGVPYELLDRARLQMAEPALARTAHKLAGGLR